MLIWEADAYLLSLPSYPLFFEKARPIGNMFHVNLFALEYMDFPNGPSWCVCHELNQGMIQYPRTVGELFARIPLSSLASAIAQPTRNASKTLAAPQPLSSGTHHQDSISLQERLVHETPKSCTQRNLFGGNRLFHKMSAWIQEARSNGTTDPGEVWTMLARKKPVSTDSI